MPTWATLTAAEAAGQSDCPAAQDSCAALTELTCCTLTPPALVYNTDYTVVTQCM